MASHAADREAAKLGYTNVWVMPDGIQGWLKAARPVESGAPRG